MVYFSKFKVLRFNLVATEVVNPTRRNSVPVTVHLLDANDNGRQYSKLLCIRCITSKETRE